MKSRKGLPQVYFDDPAPENQKPVILLHGLGSDHSSWIYQSDMLTANGFRPIAVDIPGFGKSTYPYQHWTIRNVSMLVIKAVVDTMDCQPALVGLSIGGTIAQEIVRNRPEKINKLVLVSTFAKLRPSVRKTLPYLSKRFRQVITGDIRDQAVTVADRIFPEQDQGLFHEYLIDQIRHANPKTYRQAMIALAVFNSASWMRQWGGDTLVISGDSDTTVTLENQKRLARILKNAQFEVVPKAGHAVTIDQRDRFNQLLLNFLEAPKSDE